MTIPDFTAIKTAQQRIKPYIHHTPVFTSQTLNALSQNELYFKCENFQKVGAFKFRGACNAVFSLSEAEAKAGVATHSSGNHGAALALAAQLRGIKAYVVMPENAPACKKTAVAHYGAEITYCAPTLAAREAALKELTALTGATSITPFEHPAVIAGQGTAALELLAEYPDLDILITPVGGGGLISGTAIAAHTFQPTVHVIGAEPAEADEAYRSFKQKQYIPLSTQNTLCDGLRTTIGEINFFIIQKYVHDIMTASEHSICAALRLIWERMKIIVEPSSAVALAILLEHPATFKDKKIGIILSGGNVDLPTLIPHMY